MLIRDALRSIRQAIRPAVDRAGEPMESLRAEDNTHAAPSAAPWFTTSEDGCTRMVHEPSGSGALWFTGSGWDREITGQPAVAAEGSGHDAEADTVIRDHHELMAGSSDPDVRDYHLAELEGLFDDDAMQGPGLTEPPADHYGPDGQYLGDPATAPENESGLASDTRPSPCGSSAPEASPTDAAAPASKQFTRLTAEQVTEAEATMDELSARSDREERRFTPEEAQAWRAARDMVVADTMIKAGLEPEPDAKLPAYVWDRDNTMWRPDVDGVNPCGPDPVQHAIDGEELPRGFLVPPAKSVEDACAAVDEACARAEDDTPSSRVTESAADSTSDAATDS